MSENVEMQGLEFQIKNDSSAANDGLSTLIATLNRLKSATGGGISGLSKTAANIKELSNALKAINTGDAAQKINRLTTALKALNSVNSTNRALTQLKSLPATLSALNSVSFADIQVKLQTLANALGPLSSLDTSKLGSYLTQLKKLPEIVNTVNSVDLTAFASQMQTLASALAPVGAAMQNISASFSALPSKIQKLIASTERYNKSLADTKTKTDNAVKVSEKLLKVYNVLRTVIPWSKLISGIKQCVELSNEYQEDLNLFSVTLDEYCQEAQEYADQVADIMGIDAAEWMRNQGVFDNLITGFGDSADRAYLMSKNLTQLGYDLSSFHNISVNDAFQKLQSGISGELEPLRNLGYDLSQAALEQTRLNLGINKSISEMTQAEKAEIRYTTILNQSSNALGDMSRSLEAPANQLRVLKAQVTQCGRAIGNIFIPALNAVLPYAIAFLKVIRAIADAIANLFGFHLTDVDYNLKTAVNGATGVADGLNDAADAAKKLKEYTLGFDELNVFSPDTSSSASAGTDTATGGGFDFDLGEYDFIGDAVQSRADKIVSMIKENLDSIMAIASAAALAIGLFLVCTGANIPLGICLIAAGAVGMAATIGLNWNDMRNTLKNTLNKIDGFLGMFELVLGAFLFFTGASPELGIGLMALGAASIGTSIAVDWTSSNGDLEQCLTNLENIVNGAPLALGALMAFATKQYRPLGIALMAAGLAGYAAEKAIDWESIPNEMDRCMVRLGLIVGEAELVIGAILAFTGAQTALGIGMMIDGALKIATEVSVNWDAMPDSVGAVLTALEMILSIAFIAIGAILAFSGVKSGLGIMLIAMGAVTIATTVTPNWKNMPDNVQNVVSAIMLIVGTAFLVLGAILTFSGIKPTLGIPLMLTGAYAIATDASLNWDTVRQMVEKVVNKIRNFLGGALIVLGILLCLSGAGLPLGLAVMHAGLKVAYDEWTLDDNPVINFVKKMANQIIGLVNMIIDAVNDLFHIKFGGFSFDGKEYIPALDIRLTHIAHIPLLADGGFVDEGQLFVAREAGAEMVGSLGGHTAVANNDQIVEGISAGVTVANEEVVAAIYTLINVVEGKDFDINIGDDVIGRSYDRYKQQRGRSVSSGAFANAY